MRTLVESSFRSSSICCAVGKRSASGSPPARNGEKDAPLMVPVHATSGCGRLKAAHRARLEAMTVTSMTTLEKSMLVIRRLREKAVRTPAPAVHGSDGQRCVSGFWEGTLSALRGAGGTSKLLGCYSSSAPYAVDRRVFYR